VEQSRERRLEDLYRSHARAIHAYALRRVDRATADEVAAETFVVAWRRLEDVPSEPLPWLFGVARRLVANQTRGESRRAALTMRLASETSASAALTTRLATETSASAGPVGTERTLEALEELGAGDREVLLLVAWEGLTQRQAAQALGCSHAAVRVRLHRARRRLRGILDATNAPAQQGAQEVSCDGRA
jgi:RNA polymerase sigma-70 factor (ECF subfamily)